jgi:hypothetical protein
MAETSLSLRWEPFQGSSEQASLGEVPIAMIGQLSADPGTWWYTIDGVHVKWISKGFGHVKSKASARRAVERAWDAWLSRAGLKDAPHA